MQTFAQTEQKVKKAEQRGQEPVAAFKDFVRQASVRRQSPPTPEKPVFEVPRGRPVYEGVGQHQGADLSRSIAIKKDVGRARASGELHRSNAVRGPTRALSERRKGQ